MIQTTLGDGLRFFFWQEKNRNFGATRSFQEPLILRLNNCVHSSRLTRSMVFVKAQGGPPNAGDPPSQITVQYFDEEGNMTIRSGGKRAWRCNNPGNLVARPYSTSTKRGCIGTGTDGSTEYSIYPDYKTGYEALVVMLRGSVYYVDDRGHLMIDTKKLKHSLEGV